MNPYPLTWPAATKRRAEQSRGASQFRSKPTPAHAAAEVLAELKRWDVKETDIVISSDCTMTQASPRDPGVAVYFARKGKQFVITCDRWNRVGCNLHAVALVLEGMRQMERHGVMTGEQMLSPWLALPETGTVKVRRWFDVLGVGENCAPEEVKPAYFKMCKLHHPNANGGEVTQAWYEVEQAYTTAKQLKGLKGNI